MLRRFIELLLYGHFWIALAAWLMQVQTQWLCFGHWRWSALDGFIATGTLVIYAIHRLMAMRLQQAPVYSGRFRIMRAYQSHILGYAALAALVGAFSFFQLEHRVQLILLTPSLAALAYVLPIFRGRRLRDFPYLKIFLIAFSWAWLTVVGPLVQWGQALDAQIFWMLLERASFIFAITIPFDIRDLELDQGTKVRTIPGRYGIPRAKRIAYLALVLMLLAVTYNTYTGHYSMAMAGVLALSALLSAVLIYHAHAQRHDYYYTGLLDGVMVVQTLLVGAVLFNNF